MKGVIVIFILPQEIDELQRTLTHLKRSSYYLTGKVDWTIDVTMTFSDDLVNWEKTELPKSFFEEKLSKLSNDTDWCSTNFKTSIELNGCITQRKYAIHNYKNSDFFIWLDTDILFDERILFYYESSMTTLLQTYSHFVLTPEIVKVWDDTWDCLVNEKFLDKPKNYQSTNDPYKDSGIHGQVKIESVSNNIINQPRFKFAGGWFTALSGELLRRIDLPESFGHYGADDTFIMHASEKLIKQGTDVQQFKLKNVVVCEDYKYRNHTPYTLHMETIDKREEYKKIVHNNFLKELDKI